MPTHFWISLEFYGALLGLQVILLVVAIRHRKNQEARRRALQMQVCERALESLDRLMLMFSASAGMVRRKAQILEAMGKTEEARPLYRVAQQMAARVSLSGDFRKASDPRRKPPARPLSVV